MIKRPSYWYIKTELLCHEVTLKYAPAFEPRISVAIAIATDPRPVSVCILCRLQLVLALVPHLHSHSDLPCRANTVCVWRHFQLHFCPYLGFALPH